MRPFLQSLQLLQPLLGARLLLLLLLLRSPALAETDFSTSSGLSTWNQSDWSLTTTKFIPGQFQARVSLANGYVGASLAAAGPFFEIDVNQTDPNGNQPINGWPLLDARISFSTISGFYNIQPNASGTNYPWLNQYGWESFIAGIPHPTAIIFAFGDSALNASVSNTTISNFSQRLSFKTGVSEWSYTWSPSGSQTSFNVSYAAIFSRERANVIAVSASITPSSDISGTVTDLLDGQSAVRSYLNAKGLDQHGDSIYTSVHPNGLANVTGFVVSGADFSNGYTDISSRRVAQGAFVSAEESTIGQTYNISLNQGETATFYKYVGVASSDKFPDPESVARHAQRTAQTAGWDTLLSEHTAAWARLLTEDSVDDFSDPCTGELPENPDVETLHIASIANTYYLLQNLQPVGSGLNDNSIPVGGLVSDSYAGLIFWDADYWMAPSLNLAFPKWSQQISNFRVKQYPQAMANAAFNGFPNGSAIYSWTAGRYGNCTGTGPCVDYEYHINYDITANLLQEYNITNNETWFNNGPRQIIESVALMTGELLVYNETTKTYWLHNMTDPDEYANNVDNGPFTVASAAELLLDANALRASQGLPINETWQTQAQDVAFPKAASQITLEYETMNNSAPVKQADVVLLTYPLDYNNNYTTADKLLDLDYYAEKQSPNGPAMTYSVFAIDANAVSPSGCAAYTYALNGFLPYLREPWYQFSEQAVDDALQNGGTNPAFPFLTGHGGASQVVPFGFLGVRTDQPMLYINPSLPPQIPYVKVRTFYYGGATLSATMNTTHTNITRFNTPQSLNLIDRYANTTVPFGVGTPNGSTSLNTTYQLAINQTLTVPNRLYWQILTDASNLLQCLPSTSNEPTVPGQFPVAANDGSRATAWQPAANTSATLVVDTSSVPATPVSGLFFDWGTRPPTAATVYLGNATAQGNTSEIVIVIEGIAPTSPFNATQAEVDVAVVPVVGNTTTVQLGEGVWSGTYARLMIEGCWVPDGIGATVDEFVLVGAS